MITRISKVVFPPKTVGKPLRTIKLNFPMNKIRYLNTIEKGFRCDIRISHPQKFIHFIWNILIHQSKILNRRTLSILSQVVIIPLLGSIVLSYSNGNPSKKSYQSYWNSHTSKVQSRVLDSNEEIFSCHLATTATNLGHHHDELSKISRSITNRTTGNNDLGNYHYRFGQQQPFGNEHRMSATNSSKKNDCKTPSCQGAPQGNNVQTDLCEIEYIETTAKSSALDYNIEFNGTVIQKLTNLAISWLHVSTLTNIEKIISREEPIEFCQALRTYATGVTKLELHNVNLLMILLFILDQLPFGGKPAKWSEKSWKTPWNLGILDFSNSNVDNNTSYRFCRTYHCRPEEPMKASDGIFHFCQLLFYPNDQLDSPNSGRVEIIGINSFSIELVMDWAQLALLAIALGITATAIYIQSKQQMRDLVFYLPTMCHEAILLLSSLVVPRAVQYLMPSLRIFLKTEPVYLSYPYIRRSVARSSVPWGKVCPRCFLAEEAGQLCSRCPDVNA